MLNFICCLIDVLLIIYFLFREKDKNVRIKAFKIIGVNVLIYFLFWLVYHLAVVYRYSLSWDPSILAIVFIGTGMLFQSAANFGKMLAAINNQKKRPFSKYYCAIFPLLPIFLLGFYHVDKTVTYPATLNTSYNRQPSYDEKRTWFQEFLTLDSSPEFPSPEYWNRYDRGNNFACRGEFSEAILDYSYAIDKNPNFALLYRNRAMAYYYVKDYDKAWADVHKTEELEGKVDPQFISVLKKASGRDK